MVAYMTEQYRNEYLIRLPLPLAQLYHRAGIDYSPRSHHNNTYYLFEALLRLGVAVQCAAYRQLILAGQQPDPQLSGKLGKLRMPATGDWCGLLLELAGYFAALPDAASHPLGHISDQLKCRRNDPAIIELFRRIKNGVDGAPGGDRNCSLSDLFSALVRYRNDVFGHGSERFPSFYDKVMGPLLFPAVNAVLEKGVLDLLGPDGSRLVHLMEIRTVADGRSEVTLKELTGVSGLPSPALSLAASDAEEMRPGRVAVLWPGISAPLFLEPLLQCAWDEGGVQARFLNSDHKNKVKYLNYCTGEMSMDTASARELAELLVLFGADSAEAAAAIAPTEPARDLRQEYEILGEIGRGGMGVVYLAKQLSLGRHVTLKVLRPDLAHDQRALARFRNEIKALARCEHPNIVRVLDAQVSSDGQVYCCMEYVPGCNLERVWQEVKIQDDSDAVATSRLSASTLILAARRASESQRKESERGRRESPAFDLFGNTSSPSPPLPLPPLPPLPSAGDEAGDYTRKVVQLMRDAAGALQAVHDKNLIHRDVSPANLMLTADGKRVVLMDFGLAKGSSLAALTTTSGGLLGTLRYAAPEQLAGGKEEVGPAADIRGLGATFWELLTRRRLFGEADSEAELTQFVRERDVPALRSIDPEFSADLETIVTRATERRAIDRIQSAGMLAACLQLYLDGKPLPIRQCTRADRFRGRLREHARGLAIGAAAILLTVIGTTLVVVRLYSTNPLAAGHTPVTSAPSQTSSSADLPKPGNNHQGDNNNPASGAPVAGGPVDPQVIKVGNKVEVTTLAQCFVEPDGAEIEQVGPGTNGEVLKINPDRKMCQVKLNPSGQEVWIQLTKVKVTKE